MVATRNLALMLVGYLIATAFIVVLIAAGGMCGVRASGSWLPETASDTNPLNAQLETARAVREALAKTIPGPAPLGPITAKLANPVPLMARVEKLKHRKPNAAMNAMAMDLPPAARTFQYPPVDRFAPN
jgi:hypothetical protein